MFTLSKDNLSSMAKAIKSAIKDSDDELKHSQILNALAAGLGEKNFHVLSAKLKSEKPKHQISQKEFKGPKIGDNPERDKYLTELAEVFTENREKFNDGITNSNNPLSTIDERFHEDLINIIYSNIKPGTWPEELSESGPYDINDMKFLLWE